MHVFPRKPKRTPGAFYFGEYNEIPLAPFSVSIASFNESFVSEPRHFHRENQKVYIVLSGKGLLRVNGIPVELNPNSMIHVEPNEVHFVERVLESPLNLVVVASSKRDDKVIID